MPDCEPITEIEKRGKTRRQAPASAPYLPYFMIELARCSPATPSNCGARRTNFGCTGSLRTCEPKARPKHVENTPCHLLLLDQFLKTFARRVVVAMAESGVYAIGERGDTAAWPRRNNSGANRDDGKGAIAMRRISITPFIFLFKFVGSTLFAQTPLLLSELTVDFWPEYDSPKMLVIFQGEVSEEIPLPATVTLEMPSEYGPPFAVAYRNNQGQLYDLEYLIGENGSTLRIQFDVPTRTFHLEYYDDNLSLDSSTRTYSIKTELLHPVADLILQIRLPIGARAFSSDPVFEQQLEGRDGYTYYRTSRSQLAAGSLISFGLSYYQDATTVADPSRSDTESVPELSLSPQITTNGRLGWYIGAAVALFALALIISGTIAYRRKQPASDEDKSQAKYCIHCGSEAADGARFCGNCGKKLKPE